MDSIAHDLEQCLVAPEGRSRIPERFIREATEVFRHVC